VWVDFLLFAMTIAVDMGMSAEWLSGIKRENSELINENEELERLIREASALYHRAEQLRSRPQSATTHREEEQWQSDHENLRRRAFSTASRPSSAASARSLSSTTVASRRPSNAGTWKRPSSRPVSASHRRSQQVQAGELIAAVATPSSTTSKAGGCRPGVVGTFEVFLDKSGGMSLGMKTRNAGQVLEVTKVKEGGLAAMWNAAHPETVISATDHIISVNGVQGDAIDLFQECMKDVHLRLMVQGVRPSSPAPGGNGGSGGWHREKLFELLERHDKVVLATVDSLLVKFQGREAALYRSLCKKYGEEPQSQ